ncbi:MAG TPA: OsmC family protein [Baekduia sp.]|nr:OsmC family protein [Baekduia sp.]
MTAQERLRALQTPLKERYREEPDAARVTLRATGDLADGIACSVQTGRALATAGLHPATGGDGSQLCSGDMLLEALVACAGVTLRAVATAMGIELRGGQITAHGDLDFRGTLGVDRAAPVGFEAIRLHFDLDSDASGPELDKLLELTERFCVVLQSLRSAPPVEVSAHA